MRSRQVVPALLLPSCVLALGLVLPDRSAAGPIIQDTSNEARNIAPWVGQTFTAEDAVVAVAGVYVVDFTMASVATDQTIEYRLHEGAGTAGTLLGSWVFAGLVEGFGGYADVSLAGVTLVVGNTYTLMVGNNTFEWGVESAFSTGGTTYGGGTARLFPDGGAGLPPRDLRFHVLPEVPEPATLLLIGSGLALLIPSASSRCARTRRGPARAGPREHVVKSPRWVGPTRDDFSSR